VSVYPAKGDIIFKDDREGEMHAATAPYISSPSNQTYNTGLLALYVNFHGWIFGNVWFSMSYRLDGKENETVPLEDHYFGFFAQTGGHPDKNYWDGTVELPTLSNGSHCVTVYLDCTWETGDAAGSHIHKSFDSQTVHFTVLSPIALLMEKNETYNTTEIPLDFITDVNVSQIAYSLDFHSNVTISGNTTLTCLTEGTHTIIVYAKNTFGNVTNIDINDFTIAKPSSCQSSSSQTPSIPDALLLILFLSVAIAAISILLVLTKRKTKPLSTK
jgi:hypothetical protein